MQSMCQLQVPERIVDPPADVLSMRLDILITKPARDLVDSDDRCASAFGNGNCVAQMIAVPVAEQDKVRSHRIRGSSRGGVSGKERIDNNLMSVCFDSFSSVSIPGEFRSHKNLLF